jgi:hypothetical protein
MRNSATAGVGIPGVGWSVVVASYRSVRSCESSVGQVAVALRARIGSMLPARQDEHRCACGDAGKLVSAMEMKLAWSMSRERMRRRWFPQGCLGV